MPRNTQDTRRVHDAVQFMLEDAEHTHIPPEGVEFDTIMDGDTRYLRIGGRWVKVSVMEQL